MDGTQTSEPTEAEPGSPGRASAFRRALDDQAVSEGPLDLTIPLDIAEIRAALSNSGPIPVVRSAAAQAAGSGAPAADASAPPHRHGSRRASRHAGSKRLGKIAVFVALAAAMSVGTACALVMSSGGQNASSVSLPPTTGNIPVAASEDSSQQGQISATSGSSSASATPSPSLSSPSASADASPSLTATPADGSASAGAGAPYGPTSPSASASATHQAGAPTNSASSNWVTLYRGIDDESQETSQVQTLLVNLGYLDSWRHHTYLNPDVGAQPDQNGDYGSATDDAVAEFQRDYGVDYSGQAGTCDAATYAALVQAAG